MTIFTDAATIAGKTTPSSSDVVASVDSATFTSRTTVTGVDAWYVEIVTIASTTTVSSLDEAFTHPTGYWGPFDDDDGII